MVYVADGFLRPHPLYPEGLEGKIGLRPRDVVRQRLVDPDRYLLPRPHNSAQQMLPIIFRVIFSPMPYAPYICSYAIS